MPLNLSAGGGDGDFTPYLKYNAKAGRFYIKSEAGTEVEVLNPRLLVDMEHIKTGWIYYEEGSGPEKVWDPSQTQQAAKPQGPRKFKRGFEVMVFGPDNVPGVGKVGLREFSSTATNCIAAILDMYMAYERSFRSNAGKIPFFRCDGVEPISGKYGTNYEPKFRLIGWVERTKVPELDPKNEPGASEPDWQAPMPDSGAPVSTKANTPPPANSPADYGAELNDSIPF